jgi:hypothetical protein
MAEAPRYRLITAHFIDDDLIDEGEVIEYNGTPTENMEPLNEAARDRLIAYIGNLEDGKRTPDLGDIVLRQMANRPREGNELTSPELIAAAEFIKSLAQAKADPQEPRAKSVKLPERFTDVPQTGNGRVSKRDARRLGPQAEPSGPRVRQVTGHSTAKVD